MQFDPPFAGSCHVIPRLLLSFDMPIVDRQVARNSVRISPLQTCCPRCIPSVVPNEQNLLISSDKSARCRVAGPPRVNGALTLDEHLTLEHTHWDIGLATKEVAGR
jgi:hypothetical protein